MKNKIKIQEISQADWELISTQNDMGLFLTQEWINSLAFGDDQIVYLKFVLDEKLVALIAGVLINNGRGKGKTLYFYSGPHLPLWSEEIFKACLDILYIYSKEKKYSRLFIKSFDYQAFGELDIDAYYRLPSSEYILKFDGRDFKLSSNFKRNVKKANKSGAVYYTSKDTLVLDKMLSLIDNTHQKRVGKYGKQYDPMYMANLNRQSLNELLKSGLGVLNCVEIDGEIHTVMFTLEKDKKIYFLLMGSSSESYRNGLPSFLSFNITERAIESGVEYYNMGLVPDKSQGGEGVRRFKESQGALEFKSSSYYTLFLSFPWCMLNPLFRLSKSLPENNLFNFFRRLLTH